MDPPLIPLSLSTVTTTVQNHPDSIESSPNYHIVNNETWPDNHDPLPNVPNAKLRLMCSYAGHIMPRPHDKSLSYVGGETRIVAIDRHTSLKDLCSRLSHSLLHGRAFTLKYQLPNEELDNLITVTTDEDLDNMVEEHDRLASSKLCPSSRLRVFLFFNKPDTAVSMCSLMDDVKSETWFVDALNNCGILQRGVSDSAAVDQCLVNLDGVHETNDLEAQVIVDSTPTTVVDSTKEVKQELHSVENNSSYGSSSSASSMANLPPITVHGVDVNGCGRIQEQFAQMSFGTNGLRHNLLDDGYAISSAATPMNAIPEAVRNVVNTNNNNNVNLVNVSDDDKSDHNGGLGGYRKPPIPLQLVQSRTFNATCGGFGLASPDSVASESSIASSNSFSKTVYYHHEQLQPPQMDNKAPPMPNIKTEISEHTPTLQREQIQVQDSGYTLSQQQLDQTQQLQHHHHQKQQQHQQFVYIHHPTATGQVPTMSSYYPLYPPPSQQQLHHAISQQQYPLYVMPVGPKQHVIPQGAASSAVYKDGDPPIYPTKLATPTISEVGPNVYKATMASNPAFVHIPPNRFQQQYVTLPQNIHHQTHPIAIAPSATTNYGYDQYDGSIQDQVYYTQQPPQYQSMTPGAAAAALSDVSEQFPIDNTQYPNRDSQPV